MPESSHPFSLSLFYSVLQEVFIESNETVFITGDEELNKRDMVPDFKAYFSGGITNKQII